MKTVTTTGSGNAVTAVSKSGTTVTVTKGATYNNYSLPTASSSTLGGIKVGTNLSISSGVLSSKDTTYSTATTASNGLMSSSDKIRLNNLTDGTSTSQIGYICCYGDTGHHIGFNFENYSYYAVPAMYIDGIERLLMNNCLSKSNEQILDMYIDTSTSVFKLVIPVRIDGTIYTLKFSQD